MKIIYLSLLVLLITSCESNNDTDSPQEDFMEAIVNGEKFRVYDNPSNVQAFLFNDNDGVMSFNMRGIDDVNQRIEFAIKEFDGIGAYDLKFNLEDQSDWAQISFLINSGKDYVEYNTQSALTKNGTGRLVINLIDDKKVEGTFKFFVGGAYTGSDDDVTVTNGVFRATLK